MIPALKFKCKLQEIKFFITYMVYSYLFYQRLQHSGLPSRFTIVAKAGIKACFYLSCCSSLKKPSLQEIERCAVLSDSLQPQELYRPWSSPGQNTGMSSLSLLLGIFPTQGSICNKLVKLFRPSQISIPFSQAQQSEMICTSVFFHAFSLISIQAGIFG